MTQDNGGRGPEDSADSSFFHRIGAFFRDESEDGDAAKQLQSTMQNARAKGVIGEDSFSMMEGVLKISELCASDIMIPRSRIKAINLDEPREQWMREARESGHSRFPVIDGDFSNVIGLLHAKDLLYSLLDPDYKPREHLRPVKFVTETMALNQILKDFKTEKQHLALVVDEFGEVAGLLTIEDVIEQIVGDIDDEFDTEDSEAKNIVPEGKNRWRVKAVTLLEQFNEYFHTSIRDPHCETIGGIVADRLERMPRRGDSVEAGGFRFTVLSANDRQVKLLQAERLPAPALSPAPDRK